jgi:LAO/AO transport system ATPase
MLEGLLVRLEHKDRHALARLLSLAARGENLADMNAFLKPTAAPARVVLVTGSAGVGKSTLIGKLLDLLRSRCQTVAVLASDPESPLTGGALLGDRFRMPARPQDEGIFIRSLAAKSGRGVVADHVDVMIRLLEAYGFDVILIETVGAGQGDTEVRRLADVVVLLLQPETGDDLQWEKAGLLEIADVIVIHKGDLPRAPHMEAEVRATLSLSSKSAPVLRVSAKTGEGVEALWQAVEQCSLRRSANAGSSRELIEHAQHDLAQWFEAGLTNHNPGIRQILADLDVGTITRTEAVRKLLQSFVSDYRAQSKDVMVR